MAPSVDTDVPDAATRAAILDLAAAIEREDGAPPLSDQARTLLPSPRVSHLVAHEDSRLVGYGQLAGPSLEVAALATAAPALLDAVDGPFLVWSHGARSRLVPIFETRGYTRARELYQLRRPAVPLPDDPPLPDGITVRPFVPGRDDQAWLAVNAAAFAHHAEQGSMTETDLRARLAEPWFEAEGFLLAERDGALLGFHWTKIHDDGLGEVYVLGISPDAQGLGLGSALLIRGLRHLAERGCPQVLLYADGDNPGALRLYERDGFTRYDLDVQWRST